MLQLIISEARFPPKYISSCILSSNNRFLDNLYAHRYEFSLASSFPLSVVFFLLFDKNLAASLNVQLWNSTIFETCDVVQLIKECFSIGLNSYPALLHENVDAMKYHRRRHL